MADRITKAMVQSRCEYITRQMRRMGLIGDDCIVTTQDAGGVKWWARIIVADRAHPTLALYALGTETHTTRSAYETLYTIRDTLDMVDTIQRAKEMEI